MNNIENTVYTLDYAPEKIVTGANVYYLRYPLRCLFEKEDNYFIIKSELIDIIGTGETEDEAEQNFAEEFDFIYHRYNELPDNKLSERIKVIKTFLNYIVENDYLKILKGKNILERK
ncbi:MAG: hypothetical protein FVQ77_10090 [Cytophagales bacterium]|nr:hypothetical protein [Cytophagales bacterium]